jgi:DNA-binding CsgD family transcriptional regulator
MLPTGVMLAFLERAGVGAAVCTADGAVSALNDLASRTFATIAALDNANGGDTLDRVPAMLMPALQGSHPKPVFVRGPEGRCIAAQVFTQPPNPVFLLVVADLNSRAQPPIQTLQYAFGLTRREARVAGALATGMRLQEIAVSYGVGMGTVRSQLKSIFVKTRTNRQPALVALLARLLPFV